MANDVPKPMETIAVLTPMLHTVKKQEKSFRHPKKTSKVFRIGKGEECDITLEDKSISNIQISVVKLVNQYYFMDCGTEDRVSINGVKCR